MELDYAPFGVTMSEHDEQKAVVQWFRLQYPQYAWLLFSTPNGGARHPAVAGKLKAEGVRAGVFDLFLMIARRGAHGLWIEMKTEKGVLSEHQKRFQADAIAQGYAAVVCYGFDMARGAIEEYLRSSEADCIG